METPVLFILEEMPLMIILLTSIAFYLSTIQSPQASFQVDPSLGDTCKTGQDSLTKITIYLDADSSPECEGGSFRAG